MKSIIHLNDKKNKQNHEKMHKKKNIVKVKNFLLFWTTEHGFFILITIFTSSLAFFLGKMSVISVAQSVQSKEQQIIYAEDVEKTQVVASKKGSVYHLPWCSGAVRMKEENKVYFKNIEDAKAAGYTPAKNCEGL